MPRAFIPKWKSKSSIGSAVWLGSASHGIVRKKIEAKPSHQRDPPRPTPTLGRAGITSVENQACSPISRDFVIDLTVANGHFPK